jgi:tRNA G10  N-methylase Trm11
VKTLILDATAGNRSMYTNKYSENIVYLDRQRELYIKPTIFADSQQLPFKDKSFDIILFDPPHQWASGEKIPVYGAPYRKKILLTMGTKGHTYYGVEQYKNKRQLIRYIYQSQKEFKRVLKDDGVLMLKWCEVEIPLDRLLQVFADWRELMRIPVKSQFQTMGEKQTYWVMMEKRKTETQTLTDYPQQQTTQPNYTSSKAYETLLPYLQEPQVH